MTVPRVFIAGAIRSGVAGFVVRTKDRGYFVQTFADALRVKRALKAGKIPPYRMWKVKA